MTPDTLLAVRQLIAADQLRQAIDLLLAQADAPAAGDLLQLSGRLSDLERDHSLRTESAEQLDTRRNQLRADLLDWVQRPAAAADPVAQAGLRLKKAAFRLVLVFQIALILLVLFHLDTGGYANGEALTLIGLLSPVLAGYLLTALKGYGRPGLSAAARRSLPVLRAVVWALFPLYFLLLCWVLNRNPAGDWPFETARNWVIGIEAAFGGVLAYVVRVLFGEEG
ncbi:MAG: hypothetical protein JNL02_13465 [Saprospiraceae bacterium]|nr:hypothetical protein [Saprospiraceae bacterium]